MKIDVSVTADAFDTEPQQIPLQEIIDMIRGDEELGAAIADVRAAQTDSQRKELKQALPMFFPTVQHFEGKKLTEFSKPTGLVQFDLDKKDEPGRDFEELKALVSSDEHCVYAFISPSGGLKFALLTDFKKRTDEGLESLKARYKQAYERCREHLFNTVQFVDDKSGYKLSQACSLSHDEQAYFNPSATAFAVDEFTEYEEPVIAPSREIPPSPDEVSELLSYVPRDYDYPQRLPVNFSVLAELGAEGIPVLEAHWTTKSRDKLRKDLQAQLSANKPPSLGVLVNIAKEHGYKPTPQRLKRKESARNSTYVFEPMLSPDEAKDKLKGLIHRFFTERRNTLINVSTGFGKTQTTLEYLREISPDTKVMYLVNNHQLGSEICEKFNAIPSSGETFKEQRKRKSKIVHIYGKIYDKNGFKPRCEESQNVKEMYKKSDVQMPFKHCIKSCVHQGVCNYTKQFSPMEGNIRLMSHRELINHQSSWFEGTELNDEDGYVQPRLTKAKAAKKEAEKQAKDAGQEIEERVINHWKPEYIIVDEDWLTFKSHKINMTTVYDGARNVLNHVLNCIDVTKPIDEDEAVRALCDAIEEFSDEVRQDYKAMTSNENVIVEFESPEQYIAARKELNQKYPFNPIIQVLDAASKLIENDVDAGVKYLYARSIIYGLPKRCLQLNNRDWIAARFSGVPMLFLDATANKRIAEKTIRDVEFNSVRVKSNPDISVYQLENYNWIKRCLDEPAKREKLVRVLNPYVEDYESVGLITYMNVDGQKDFDEWLANRLGISVYGHFGKLRGLDAFADVDCLLIVGRHMMQPDELAKHVQAFFGFYPDEKQLKPLYSYIPIRMRDGGAKELRGARYANPCVQACHQHFNVSETIQAVGRARLIHGKPKDVYLFSKESLGAEVEITGFFRQEEDKFSDVLNKLREIGFCEFKPKELRELGLNDYQIKHNRKEFEQEASSDEGIEVITLKVRDKSRNVRQRKYLVSNRKQLQQHLDSSGCVIV